MDIPVPPPPPPCAPPPFSSILPPFIIPPFHRPFRIVFLPRAPAVRAGELQVKLNQLNSFDQRINFK